MDENRLVFLSDAFPDHKIDYLDNGYEAVILNALGDDNIRVGYYDEDEFTPFIVSFSFQHCHLCCKEDVVEWINDIISGKKYAIEFFEGGRDRFGGDIEAARLESVSYEDLEQYFGYYGLTKLFQTADSFKVRGWDPTGNFDAKFVFNNETEVLIEKLPQINTCEECGSEFYAKTSSMTSLCPECAHIIYGYPPCEHQFSDGRCAICYWDGSCSGYIKRLQGKSNKENIL